MSLAQATLVQRVRWEQKDFPWETTGSAATSSSVVVVADGDDWAEGEIGEFQNNGELFFVLSKAANSLTCTRGYYGTTAATQASGRIVKAPRHKYVEITNAISSVINDRLWPKAWKKTADTVTPTPSSGTVWYDLAAAALGIISARQLYSTSDLKEGRYGTTKRFERRIEFRRNMTAGLAASGVGVRFPDGFFHASNTVNIDYAAKITDAVSNNNYSDLTAGDAVVEAVIFGAVAHLEESGENSKPRKPRSDRETVRGAALYERKFQEALNRAQMECRDTIPIMPNLHR